MRLISYRTFRSAPIFFLFGCSLVNSFWNGLDVFRLWISAGFVVLEFGVWSLMMMILGMVVFGGKLFFL